MSPLFARREPLPAAREPAHRAFTDCAELVEGSRRLLLGTLPAGRVEPAPIGVGLDAVADAITSVRGWMPGWRVEEVADAWDDCAAALDESEQAIDVAREVAATTTELEELLGAVEDVVVPLDAFADAERAWRDAWRLPRR